MEKERQCVGKEMAFFFSPHPTSPSSFPPSSFSPSSPSPPLPSSPSSSPSIPLPFLSSVSPSSPSSPSLYSPSSAFLSPPPPPLPPSSSSSSSSCILNDFQVCLWVKLLGPILGMLGLCLHKHKTKLRGSGGHDINITSGEKSLWSFDDEIGKNNSRWRQTRLHSKEGKCFTQTVALDRMSSC